MSKSIVPQSLSIAPSSESEAVRWRDCLGVAPALLILFGTSGALAQTSATPSATQPPAASTSAGAAEHSRAPAAAGASIDRASAAAAEQARAPAAAGAARAETPAGATATAPIAPSETAEPNLGAASNTAATTAPPTHSVQPTATAIQPAEPAQAANATESPAPSDCKQEWSRSGFYLRGVFTSGYVGLSGTGPAGKPSIDGFGGGSMIAIGGSVAQGLVLAGMLQASQTAGNFKGGPYQGATFTSGGERISVSQNALAAFSQIGALIDWYPTQSGFHVGLSGGFSPVALTLNADDEVLVGGGTSGTLLIGYDWPVSRTIAMGINLVGSATSRIQLKYDGERASGYELSGRSIGIGGSFLYF